MKKLSTVLLICLSFTVFAQFAQPFKWDAKSEGNTLTVSVDIPPKHYLYGDKRTVVTVSGPNGKIEPESSPALIKHTDEFGSWDILPSGKQIWNYSIIPENSYKISIQFQGCKEQTAEGPAICFMPSEETFSINTKLQEKSSTLEEDIKMEGRASRVREEVAPSDDKTKTQKLKFDPELLDQFDVVNTGGGYLNKKEFLAFLEKDQALLKEQEKDSFAEKGTLAIIFLVLLGGLALNFTPCVLPMIPINLAIIGAGESNDKKSRGFFRGAVYGIGIAAAYGLLGVITVLGGAKFGTLNSASWFNFIIAAVFVVLGLAMFDLFVIDFTRFSAQVGVKQPGKGALIPVFLMGVIAALLAGACVAPVVIAVLLYSTNLYAEGNVAGLVLPFVLGIGMALPWPFAGAGIAFLPKPGKWMVRVKQLMGVFIFLFAAYYAYIAITLLPDSKTEGVESSFAALKKGLLQAKSENKPVFIDFWASWCKNCSQMDRTTFKDPEVIERLDAFVVIKFQAEQPGQPEVKKILDRYKLIGLPGYVVLKRKHILKDSSDLLKVE